MDPSSAREDHDNAGPGVGLQRMNTSAFLLRQAERDEEMTGLSPMDEMKVAESELLAMRILQRNSSRNVKGDSHGEHKSLGNSNSSSHANKDNRMVVGKALAQKWRRKIKRQITGKKLNVEDETTTDELKHYIKAAKNEEQNSYEKHVEVQKQGHPWYIIHPHHKFRLRWDLASIFLILYNALMIPFLLSFVDTKVSSMTDSSPREEWKENVEDFLIDIFFIVDMILNFFSAFERDGHIEFDQRKIALNYAKTWLPIDFISAFPFYLVFQSTGFAGAPKLTRMLRLVRLIRLFRMFRIMRILKRLEYALLIRSTISSLLKFILLVSFSSHWFSCTFYYISVSSDANDTSWVRTNHLHLGTVSDQYIASFYWSIMTMTTVGFGDISAMNTAERAFSIVAMIIGAGIFAYGITNVVAMVANLNAVETEFRSKMDGVNAYMDARKLPRNLRGEIREFFHNARKSKETNLNKEAHIFKDLSALLRSKIAFAVNDAMIRTMPFFHGAEPNFIMELALRMSMVCFAPFEVIVYEHELGEEMFFIFRGAVEVIKDEKTIVVLGEKQYFGEMAILNEDNKRTATIRTISFCELRMLTRVQFLKTLKSFPSMIGRMKELAGHRQERDDHDIAVSSTDSKSHHHHHQEVLHEESGSSERATVDASSPEEKTTTTSPREKPLSKTSSSGVSSLNNSTQINQRPDTDNRASSSENEDGVISLSEKLANTLAKTTSGDVQSTINRLSRLADGDEIDHSMTSASGVRTTDEPLQDPEQLLSLMWKLCERQEVVTADIVRVQSKLGQLVKVIETSRNSGKNSGP